MKRGEHLKKYDHTGPTYKTRPLEYRVWGSMWSRCRNPSNDDFYLYGGRGVTVCDRWLKFENFYADMGPRPVGYTLDRINSHGNYEPTNCRWATPKEQARNWRTRNRLLILDGISKPLAQWAEESGLKRETLRDRLKSGWTVDRAIKTPLITERRRDNRGVFLDA